MPPPATAELPLTVQLVSVSRARSRVLLYRPPPLAGGVAADSQLVSVVVPPDLVDTAAAGKSGGVAADGAVVQRGQCRHSWPGHRRCHENRDGVAGDGAIGQRGRAVLRLQAAAAVIGPVTELPLMVQLVSVVCPP